MESIKEDEIANQVLEGLPPSFMVFGTKKDLDPLEEFWMNKLTNIERQYDQHVVELERKLLNERANKRSIRKQAAKLSNLTEELGEQSTEIERWKTQAGSLNAQLKDKEYEAKSLREKLDTVSTVSKNISKRMEDERQARIQYEKECANLKNRLRVLEKEKAQLHLDVEIKESEKTRVEEREFALHEEKWHFIRNISDLGTECRIQTSANLKLCEDMEKLLGVEKSLEVGLLRERQVMSELTEEMKALRRTHHSALRRLETTTKEKRDFEESLTQFTHRHKDLERDVRHWKEELEFKEKDSVQQNQEIRDLKRRNSNIRCILADTKHKLSGVLSEMKSLKNEKRRAEVELESAQRHEKALQLEIKKNELRKYKLAERILKANPYLFQRGGENGSRAEPAQTGKGGRDCEKTELESYKKRIWKLERHKDEVERKLRELQRKENIYRMKLDKYAGMEKQIFWMGKAMAKLEGDRNRLEQLLKTMESNMPMKVPFKKLVTDPSVLDRLAKNKILQRRLFQQAEKIEELKSSSRRILQFREEQFSAMDQVHEEIPSWKLAYWSTSHNRGMMTPENLLSGLCIDIMKRVPHPEGTLMKPFTDESYYKNYMHHLNEEIPKLRREIEHLEQKKLYIETEKESAEELSKRKAVKGEPERVKMSTLMLPEEQPVDEPLELSEQDGGRGQCTPELSIHGSSFDDTRQAGSAKTVRKMSNGKQENNAGQTAGSRQSSLTDDEGNDESDDDGHSSDAASEIPSDK